MTTKRRDNAKTDPSFRQNSLTANSRFITCVTVTCVAFFLLSFQYLGVRVRSSIQSRTPVQESLNLFDTRCNPYLPAQLTLIRGLSPSDPALNQRGHILDYIIRGRTSKDDIDNLTLGIVGPSGLLWSRGYGIREANRSAATEPPNEHSIYRIASVSRLYATLETFIQRDRGALNW